MVGGGGDYRRPGTLKMTESAFLKLALRIKLRLINGEFLHSTKLRPFKAGVHVNLSEILVSLKRG